MLNSRLERLTDSDFAKAEEFVKCMNIMYTSTLCVSSEKSPTCGQILPILAKLEAHFKVTDEDSLFVSAVKEKVWGDLEKRYQVLSIPTTICIYFQGIGKPHHCHYYMYCV